MALARCLGAIKQEGIPVKLRLKTKTNKGKVIFDAELDSSVIVIGPQVSRLLSFNGNTKVTIKNTGGYTDEYTEVKQ